METLFERAQKKVMVTAHAGYHVGLMTFDSMIGFEAAVQAGKLEAEKRDLYITHKVIARQSEEIEWFAHLSALGKDKLR
jgi:hypothetical protein